MSVAFACGALGSLFSPALASRHSFDEPPREGERVYLVVSSKVHQVYPQAVEWFAKNLEPEAFIASTCWLYDITGNRAAFEWIGKIYEALGQEPYAKWALEMAKSSAEERRI